jgi:hypothetical protein
MPYYLGADMPEWGEHTEREESVGSEPPAALFKYMEPWQANTTVLPFPDTPGPEPEVPPLATYGPPPLRKPGFFARLFGRNTFPAAEPSRLSTEQWMESFRNHEQATSAHALWKVAGLTAACRALGVKRVFGSYDGGGDESFTYYHGTEMRDGGVISEELLGKIAEDIDCDQLVENAVAAIMGGFDAGDFVLHGAIVIDFEACTITDEKDPGVVFGDKMAWRS